MADLESDATVAKFRISLAKGLTRGAWPQSIIALDLGIIVVIGIEWWMEAWLKVLRSNSLIAAAVIIRGATFDTLHRMHTFNWKMTRVGLA